MVTVSFIVCQALRPLLSPAAEAMLSNIPPEPSNWWGAPANRKLALTSWQMDAGNLFPPVFLGREQALGHSPSQCLTLIGELLHIVKYEIRGYLCIQFG